VTLGSRFLVVRCATSGVSHPAPERLGRASDFRRERFHRRPLGSVVGGMVLHQSHARCWRQAAPPGNCAVGSHPSSPRIACQLQPHHEAGTHCEGESSTRWRISAQLVCTARSNGIEPVRKASILGEECASMAAIDNQAGVRRTAWRFAQRPQALTRGHFYFVKNGDISISR